MLLLRSIGVLIVGFWLVMMGILIVRNNFNKNIYPIDNKYKSSHKTASSQTPVQEWMEIFLHNRKIGYSHTRVQPLDGGHIVRETIFLRLNLLGRPSIIESETRALLDRDFRLRNFSFSMRSGATAFRVRGEVRDHWMFIRRKGSPERKIRLEGPLYIGSSLTCLFKYEPLQVGKSLNVPFFDPSTLARKHMVIRVTGRETVKIHDIPYKAYRLEGKLMGQPLSFWVNEKGDMLKETGLMGLRLVRSNVSRATKDIAGGGSEEFYELASVQCERRLPRPRELQYLKVRLDGIDKAVFETSALNDGRQRYERGTLEITVEQVPIRGSYLLPKGAHLPGMKRYLEPEVNIETDDPGIRKAAQTIVGQEQDPVSVARRFLAWVYVKLDKRPVISVPSARDVLKSRAGDCNEHATLLTALLRASGIPARLCAGLVYAGGRFYYHAWTECWVGKWISMDATLDQVPADATHIALARGNLEKQTAIIALMGKLKVKVLDYGYDRIN